MLIAANNLYNTPSNNIINRETKTLCSEEVKLLEQEVLHFTTDSVHQPVIN